MDRTVDRHGYQPNRDGIMNDSAPPKGGCGVPDKDDSGQCDCRMSDPYYWTERERGLVEYILHVVRMDRERSEIGQSLEKTKIRRWWWPFS